MAELDPYREYPLASIGRTRSKRSPGKPLPSPTYAQDYSEQSMLRDGDDTDAILLQGASRRYNCAVLIPALLTSVLTAGAASALLGWLMSRRVTTPDNVNSAFHNALVAAEMVHTDGTSVPFLDQTFGVGSNDNSDDSTGTTLYGLAVSPLVAHLVSFTIPFILGIFAYFLASMWVRDQMRRHIESLPTPTQYDHLVGLCGSFGFSSFYDTARLVLNAVFSMAKALTSAKRKLQPGEFLALGQVYFQGSGRPPRGPSGHVAEIPATIFTEAGALCHHVAAAKRNGAITCFDHDQRFTRRRGRENFQWIGCGGGIMVAEDHGPSQMCEFWTSFSFDEFWLDGARKRKFGVTDGGLGLRNGGVARWMEAWEKGEEVIGVIRRQRPENAWADNGTADCGGSKACA
ncbi:hypothetical protein DFH09DRAFT_1094009 [Mycena vulgaris]|nr:hypothetical protein DFH09DRAFT_1094009 [Mycena vulgaris]